MLHLTVIYFSFHFRTHDIDTNSSYMIFNMCIQKTKSCKNIQHKIQHDPLNMKAIRLIKFTIPQNQSINNNNHNHKHKQQCLHNMYIVKHTHMNVSTLINIICVHKYLFNIMVPFFTLQYILIIVN